MWSFSKSIKKILIDNLNSRCDLQWNRRKSHVFELSWQITTFKFCLYGVGSTDPKRLHPNLFPPSTHTENKYFKSIQCDNNAFQNHISQAIDEHWMNSENLEWVYCTYILDTYIGVSILYYIFHRYMKFLTLLKNFKVSEQNWNLIFRI